MIFINKEDQAQTGFVLSSCIVSVRGVVVFLCESAVIVLLQILITPQTRLKP
jgi:hypothetical protein